jgi:23S rRNA pseudouridine1911/1915/1917 synthase
MKDSRKDNTPKGDKRATTSRYTIFKVNAESQLLEFIMKKMDGISRSKAKSILSGNGVLVDKRIESHFDFQLKPGMTVEISKHKSTKKKENNPYFHVVYEDNWLIIVDKEPGVLSMRVGKNKESLKELLDKYFENSGQKCTAHVVHRLDRETSGLMIYAKSNEVKQILADNWQDIILDRRYIAVVCGKMEQDGGRVANWLRDTADYVTYSSPKDNGGKYAVTDYHTLKIGQYYSLVELHLETGRKNQIRVHMKDIGHPIAGDFKYGSSENPIGRLALHAYRLFFTHPITQKRMEFETPYPEKFLRLTK